MTYNYVTVEGQYQDGAGNGRIGRVEWYPTDPPITDSSTGLDIDAPPQVVQLDSTGAYSVSLLATDNANLSTFGWTFVQYVQGEDQQQLSYQVLHASGATQQRNSLPLYDPS